MRVRFRAAIVVKNHDPLSSARFFAFTIGVFRMLLTRRMSAGTPHALPTTPQPDPKQCTFYPEPVLSFCREHLSLGGISWWIRCFIINCILFILLFFLTTPAIIISTMDKFNVTKPVEYLNVRVHSQHIFITHWSLLFILRFSVPSEPHRHPVLPNPAALGLFSTAAHHCLLLCVLRGPLDQVPHSTVHHLV